MARRGQTFTDPNTGTKYTYQGGTRRNWIAETGDTLSRRQFDQRFGRLAGTGLTFERLRDVRREAGIPRNVQRVVTRVDGERRIAYRIPTGTTPEQRAAIVQFAAREPNVQAVRMVYRERGRGRTHEGTSTQWFANTPRTIENAMSIAADGEAADSQSPDIVYSAEDMAVVVAVA